MVQLPDQPASPEYVRTDTANTTAASGTNAQTVAVSAAPAQTAAAVQTSVPVPQMDPGLKQIDNGVRTLQLNPTADLSKQVVDNTSSQPETNETAVEPKASAAPSIRIHLGSQLAELKVGEKVIIPVLVDGSALFRSGVIGLKFDDKKLAIRSVTFGDVYGPSLLNSASTPFLNQNGKLYVSLTSKGETGAKAGGTLAFIEVESLAAGRPEITFDGDVLNFLTSDGKNFQVKFDK